MPIAAYGSLWVFDLFITSSGTADEGDSNNSGGTTQATTTLAAGGINSQAPTTAAIGAKSDSVLVIIFQIVRFLCIYLIPPYGLTSAAVQIEGVCLFTLVSLTVSHAKTFLLKNVQHDLQGGAYEENFSKSVKNTD